MTDPPEPDDAEPVPGEASFEPRARRVLVALYRVLEGPAEPRSYWLTRALILRLLGLVYTVAFAGALVELVPLIGEHGLLPVGDLLQAVHARLGDDATTQLPTLFWLDHSDRALQFVAAVGLGLSIAVLLGLTQAGAMIVLWVLYLSIDHVGQRWFAFGWESQLLETGLLAALVCPWGSLGPFPRRRPPSKIPIVLMRWLAFRMMLGAGLIKLRGDACWRDLTCLHYHFETQPIPGPLSSWFHHLPTWVLSGGVAFNHLVEVVVPFCVFGPRRLRLVAGILLVAFQCTLIASGNLSFLNWLTIVPCLACFDDAFLARLLPGPLRRRFSAWLAGPDVAGRPARATTVVAAVYALQVAVLSVPVVVNLSGLGGSQSMNRSYDRLHLVNTYGAFGSVGKHRVELQIEGTLDDPEDPDARWIPYAFECKPGDPKRTPCWITPYHRRLDWLIWFAGIEAAGGTLAREVWVLRLVQKLLEADPAVLGLLDGDPFDGRRPAAIRIELYLYRFAPPGSDAVWQRRRLGQLIRPVTLDDPALQAELKLHGWL